MRDMLLYILWKSITGDVPNIGMIIRRDINSRNGTKLEVPITSNISVKRRNSLPIKGPEIFNTLPAHIRDLTLSQECFEGKLDEFLSLILDIQQIGMELKNFHSNKRDSVIRQWEWQLCSQPRYSNMCNSVSGGAATY